MSYLKRKYITTLTGAEEILSPTYMGEVILNPSADSDLWLGFEDNGEGVWFRTINISDYEIEVFSATPNFEATPTQVGTLQAQEKGLFFNDGTEWIMAHGRNVRLLYAGDFVNGNYAYIDENGFMQFFGSGVLYDDLPPNPIIKSKVGGSGIPTLASFIGNIQQYTFAVNDYMYDNFELMHTYANGTDLEFHIHWATNSNDGTDRNVKWEVEYTVCNLNPSGTFTYVFPSATIISQQTTIPASTTTRTSMYTSIGIVTGTSFKIGAIVCYRLRRIASTGTAPASDPFGIQCGIHVRHDTIGSRTYTAK